MLKSCIYKGCFGLDLNDLESKTAKKGTPFCLILSKSMIICI